MLLFSVIVLTAEFRSDKAQILLQDDDDDDEGPPACVLTNIPVITGLWWRHAKTHVPGSKKKWTPTIKRIFKNTIKNES